MERGLMFLMAISDGSSLAVVAGAAEQVGETEPGGDVVAPADLEVRVPAPHVPQTRIRREDPQAGEVGIDEVEAAAGRQERPQVIHDLPLVPAVVPEDVPEHDDVEGARRQSGPSSGTGGGTSRWPPMSAYCRAVAASTRPGGVIVISRSPSRAGRSHPAAT